MNVQIGTGDAPVTKDPNYQKAMRHLKKCATTEDSQLEMESILELERREARVREMRRTGGAAAAAAAAAEFTIKTKAARARQARSRYDENNDDDEEGAAGGKRRTRAGGDADDDEEENEEDDDDDEEDGGALNENGGGGVRGKRNSALPSYITEALRDDDNNNEVPKSPSTRGAAAAAGAPTSPNTPKRAEADRAYFASVERIASEQAIPGAVNALPVIWIQNLVVTAFTETFVNLGVLLPHLLHLGVYRNTKRFPALMRRTLAPRSSTLAFSNGKFVNTGSQTVEAARMSIQSLVSAIAAVEVQSAPGVYARPYADMRIRSDRVHNMVGSLTVPFRIDLRALAKQPFVTYFKELFVGAIVTVFGISAAAEDKRVKALVFDYSVVITGTKTTEHIVRVFQRLYPYLARSAVQSTTPVDGRAANSRKRRVEADVKKAAALTDTSAARMIKISADYLVDEFRAQNDNRETAQQALLRDEAEQRGGAAALPTLMTASRNLVALSSMIEKEHTQHALRAAAAAAAPTSKKRRLLIGAAAGETTTPQRVELLEQSAAARLYHVSASNVQ